MNDSLLNRDPLDPAITECPFDYYQALREEGGVSQGVHFCPGAPLARLESAIAFEQLFERLQNFQLDESSSDLRHLPSFTHRSLRKVQITFERTVTATTR
ncbi:MAG: hypothetical protein ABGY43_13595 [bacterium]|jgi:cytochrome P450|nr:hypothetical protein [Gammaproteobacteria bacterium]HIL84544.1 hypothetical protein [Pseudomonadales bacterium]